MPQGRLLRAATTAMATAALAAVTIPISPAMAETTPAVPRTAGEPVTAQTAADIAECLKNPNMPAEQEVDRSTPLLPDRPSPILLFCGNPEVYGVRHITADHPINNPVSFAECYVGATASAPPPTPEPWRNSLVFNWAGQHGGPGVTVVIDDQDHDVITAFTHGPNSAAWDACAASIPGP